MELELAADPESVAGLSRLRTLTACRNGRPRTHSIKIVWHDGPEHALLADGLTVAEQRGVQRLERIVPGSETWLPGQPVPVLADAATLPSPLAPLAAFEGRQTTSVHLFGDEAVTLTVAKGVLRTVTAEQPASRIWLSGEARAVRAAAEVLAGTGWVTIPVASLAAEAAALATGRPAIPRHEGAPALPPGPLSVIDALRHVLGHLIDVILANAPIAVSQNGNGSEAVHQMRVAVRRARSALSIFQTVVPAGSLDRVGENFKDLGSRLGPTRDWDVFAEETAPTIQKALPNDERLERLIAAAHRRRLACQKTLAAYLGSAAFRMLGIELAWFIATDFWHPKADVLEAEGSPPHSLTDFAGSVLQHRWKKLLSSGKRIEDLDIASLHGVRLRAKRARYAAEIFSTLHHPKSAHRFVRRLSALQERLGVLNDGAMANHLLAELGGPSGRHAYATGVIVGFLAGRAAKIRPRIVRAFEKFRRQPIFWG